jgi:hypothetical protein
MIKNDKVFELRIDDEDELSGIDSISLVDEPAIEVNWMYFNKEKEHEFHIPDGEDEKYIQKLVEKAQDEQELFNEGWVVHDVQILGKQGFVSTDPNGPSIEDEEEYNVRYKYILNPNISESAIISTTRDFCKTLINRNYVWRVEDMESTTNDFGDSAMVWRGGYNCRHVWSRILYKKDATIVNKASVNRGKVDVGGFPSGLAPDTRVLGYTQPSTVTSKTAANPSPSTVRNLGLSKEKMEIVAPNVNVFGYHTRYFELCPLAQELFQHLVTMEMDEDTQGMVRSAARAADNVFRIEGEVINAESATQHQYEDALISVDDIKDIMYEVDERIGMKHDVSFMDGHIEKIKEYLKEDMGYDVGGIGGYVDPGVKTGQTGNTISKSLTPPTMFESTNEYPESASNNACKVLRWREEHGDEVKGMTQIGWTRANQLCNKENISEETIARMASFARHRQNAEVAEEFKSTPWKDKGYVAWLGWGGTSGIEWASNKLESIRNNMSKQKFQTDDEKKIVIGPAMIPDLKIFRKDTKGNPYYVYFSSETIKMIAEKYMRNKYIDNNDQMHDGKAVSDVYVFESWIKESENDKSTDYGYGELPIGTWFVSMKVRNPKIWEKVKQGQLNGFSVSGYFEEVASFCREEMFLQKVAQILKNIED